jgi:hypothetical protein
MPRPQFRISTLLWITLAVACWFGGMRFERWNAERDKPTTSPITHRGKIIVESTWVPVLRWEAIPRKEPSK